MFISIHDVPHDEQHLLYCSQLDTPSGRRRHRTSSAATTVRRALAIHGELLDPMTFSPPNMRPRSQPNLRCA